MDPALLAAMSELDPEEKAELKQNLAPIANA